MNASAAIRREVLTKYEGMQKQARYCLKKIKGVYKIEGNMGIYEESRSTLEEQGALCINDIQEQRFYQRGLLERIICRRLIILMKCQW